MKTATDFLKKHSWSLEQAMDQWFMSGGSGSQADQGRANGGQRGQQQAVDRRKIEAMFHKYRGNIHFV